MTLRSISCSLLLVVLICSCSGRQISYDDLTAAMSSSLRSSLVILGHTASQAHPKLDLNLPIEPLPAAAPLRYTNEGDLLKLRLLLNNVTLRGLSSLTVQEITFKRIDFTLPRAKETNQTVQLNGLDSPTEPVIFYEAAESTALQKTIPSNPHNYNDYNKKTDETTHDYNYHDGSYDSYYYYDEAPPIAKEHANEDFDEGFSEDFEDYNTLHDEPAPFKRTVAHTRYERSASSKKLRHSRYHKPRRVRSRSQLVFQIKRPEASKTSEKLSRHHHEGKRDHGSGKSIRSAPAVDSEASDPITLSSNVRVSFSNLLIDAKYVIRGSAGGVFTFKEQGKLELIIPNVFITSRFNVTVTPDRPGMRHWNSRKNHIRVQKIQTRMTLESPKLKLIPDSRSPEWIRRQVQEKMDELGTGVGRRDGAIRLLLRHWAKLLRKLVLKASKNQ